MRFSVTRKPALERHKCGVQPRGGGSNRAVSVRVCLRSAWQHQCRTWNRLQQARTYALQSDGAGDSTDAADEAIAGPKRNTQPVQNDSRPRLINTSDMSAKNSLPGLTHRSVPPPT